MASYPYLFCRHLTGLYRLQQVRLSLAGTERSGDAIRDYLLHVANFTRAR